MEKLISTQTTNPSERALSRKGSYSQVGKKKELRNINPKLYMCIVDELVLEVFYQCYLTILFPVQKDVVQIVGHVCA